MSINTLLIKCFNLPWNQPSIHLDDADFPGKLNNCRPGGRASVTLTFSCPSHHPQGSLLSSLSARVMESILTDTREASWAHPDTAGRRQLIPENQGRQGAVTGPQSLDVSHLRACSNDYSCRAWAGWKNWSETSCLPSPCQVLKLSELQRRGKTVRRKKRCWRWWLVDRHWVFTVGYRMQNMNSYNSQRHCEYHANVLKRKHER